MAEILTESFCEQCGSRYTFEAGARRRRGLGRIRTLSRGVKNFVANDDASFSDAMALARDEDERKVSLAQLDAFHRTFNFCLTCRQYTCRNCWNSAAGECLSCAPDLGLEVRPAAFLDLELVGPAAAPATLEEPQHVVAASAWPSVDVRTDTARPAIVAAVDAPAADAVPELAVVPWVAPTASREAPSVLAPAAESVSGTEVARKAEASPADTAALPADTAGADVDHERDLEPEAAPVGDQVAVLAPEPVAAPPTMPVDETDLELTESELAVVEGALSRQLQRAESAAAIRTPAEEIAPLQASDEGRQEPAQGPEAETRRFFQRFRLSRVRPAGLRESIGPTSQDDSIATASPPQAESVGIVAPEVAPEPERVMVEVVAAAPEQEPVVVVEAAAEQEPAALAAAAEPMAIEIASAPEPEPAVMVEAAAEREPVMVAAAPRSSRSRPPSSRRRPSRNPSWSPRRRSRSWPWSRPPSRSRLSQSRLRSQRRWRRSGNRSLSSRRPRARARHGRRGGGARAGTVLVDRGGR